MTCVQFTVSGKPTAWQRVSNKRGQKFTSPEMRAAQKAIGTLCRVAMGSLPPMVGPVRLEVLAVYAIPPSWPAYKQEAARAGKVWKASVPDLDNLGKMVDALNGIAWVDDSQVVLSSMGKRYGHPARTEFKITLLDVLCDSSPKDAIKAVADDLRGQTTMTIPASKARNTKTNGGPK